MNTKVLIVDDDVVSRMVLMHLIDGCGQFDILEAEDGQEAWEQLQAGLRPAILFCDLRMPRLSGMDLLQKVRADGHFGHMPFILVSSATDQETVEQASDFGAAGYIVKPFQADQVRVHMAAFARSEGVVDAEAPQDTMTRLGINGERLLVYLGGFQSQLTGASGEIDALIARGEQQAAQLRLERLHAGCITLGLHGAARAIKACTAGGLHSEQVQAALAEAVHAVIHQSDITKRLSLS